MGRAFSSLKREIKNANVENRAFKVISKDDVRPPPKYPSTVKEIKILQKEYGVTVEDIVKKDAKLNSNLKNVFVVSKGSSTTLETTKQLPQTKFTDLSDMEYGYVEPETTAAGNISLKRTLELLSKHNDDPSNWTPAKLANHYGLDIKFVEQLMDRYNVFELHLPNKISEKANNASLKSQVQLQIAVQNIHKLGVIKKQKKGKDDSTPAVIE